ncbi:hypothetical protein MesoLjLb_60840 [Mesorhizobium sp. L-8-3]|nr:hypothetical protein MesoLjLb_60840 [Mesorhizobium sp. L-8-3]
MAEADQVFHRQTRRPYIAGLHHVEGLRRVGKVLEPVRDWRDAYRMICRQDIAIAPRHTLLPVCPPAMVLSGHPGNSDGARAAGQSAHISGPSIWPAGA